MRTIEILLVERSDDGEPVDGPILLVEERLYRGEAHPNGVLFRVPVEYGLMGADLPLRQRGNVAIEDVRPGFSLHEKSCPRSDPSPSVSASCTCRRTSTRE